MDRKERLRLAYEFLKNRGAAHTQQNVADMLGKPKSSVSSAFNGNERYLTENFVKDFCEAYGGMLSPKWIWSGDGPMIVGDNNQSLNVTGGVVVDSNGRSAEMKQDASPLKVYMRENLVDVPYVPVDAKASFVESLYDTAYEMDTYGVMAEDGEDLSSGEYVVFQIGGDSMSGQIPHSSKILARFIPERKWESASGVIVIVFGKTITIKRVLKNSLFGKNVITLKADNPVFGQIDVERSEIRGMWQALRIVSYNIK